MSRLLIAAAAVLLTQAGTLPGSRQLVASGSIRGSLAGGEAAVFSVDVPAGTAARIVVTQEGVDVALTLRRDGDSLPAHGLNFTAGPAGDEVLYPAISDGASRWTIGVAPALGKAARGAYLIHLDLSPADERARAIAAARARHYEASEAAWSGEAAALRRAQAGYAAAAESALAAGDGAQAAESSYQCGRTFDVLGDVPAAITWQERALERFRQIGRRDREARVLDRLGDLSRKTGRVTEAEAYFRAALPLAREAGDASNVADILNNSGLLLLSIGRFEEAIDQLEGAIPLAREVESADIEGALTHNLGEAYARLGEYERAMEFYERSIEIKRRLNLPRRTARTLYALATVAFENGDRPRAGRAVRTAIDLFEQSGDRMGQAETLGFFGRLQYANGEAEPAIASFERAAPVLRELQNRGAEAQVLTAWAEVEVDRGAIAPALARLDEAVSLTRAIGNPYREAGALYVRARALQKHDRLEEAIESIAGAVERIEAMRGGLARNDFRTSYLAGVRRYFDLYIDLLQQRGSTEAAFEMNERARARTLLDGLAESTAKIRKGVDPDLLARQRRVQAELNAREAYRAQVATTQGAKGPQAVAAGRDVERLLAEWADVDAAIRVSSPAYWALKRPEPVTVRRVQERLLDGGSALVEYHLGRDRSYVWVVDRQQITMHHLPAAAKLDDLARQYHGLLSTDTAPLTSAARETLAHDIAAAGRRLAALVWTPVEGRVRGRRLVIVADGALQYVPFAALPTSAGDPVIATHELVYLPSASVLETLRRDSRSVPAHPAIAVFADPVFSKSDPRLAMARDQAAPAAVRAGDGGTYARLRFSRQEADAIAAASPGAFQALDFSAAKATLRSRNLRQYGILHFATHGTLNAEQPELSGLVFSLVDRAGKPSDGYLRLHEIYNLDLDADLVVLSACQTALGREVHGEGLIGLTRGFMYAGASRVVSSVWNVDDRASALLMARFYQAMLARRLAPAAALRDAQLSLLAERRWSNPHYWAAFGLQGEWK